MELGRYSFGVGDRFGIQGCAQLEAIQAAREFGIDIACVWNKSQREHKIIGTHPADVRQEADAAVKALNYQGKYFVDADHIGLNNVDEFIEASDFFTLDVADFIGQRAPRENIDNFLHRMRGYVGKLEIDGIDRRFDITTEVIAAAAEKFLLAIQQAKKIYQQICQVKGPDNFITEVSMDETDQPQSPVEMLFILAAIADRGIEASTVAPKFTGRFNKGVDYVGDVEAFSKEFSADVAVIQFAVEEFEMRPDLKLSVHSGSDKFSIYEPMRDALMRFDAGLHLKTAGTTWLEEVAGLALAGGDALALAKDIYTQALARFDELCAPYATVIDIDRQALPAPEVVREWDSERFAAALKHEQSCEYYDPNFRQLLHVAYKVAAEMKGAFLPALERHRDIVEANVTENILERHITPLFVL